MTKNDLINLVHRLKIDLKYLKRDLDFRLRGNDVDATNEKYDGIENQYAYKSGTFEAMVKMDNDTFERAIKTIEEMEKSMAS
jgi:NADH:ubiquinone oxidoreductase subunit D